MSLASQVTALATAVGNQIQALTSRVDTLEADTAEIVQQDAADPGRTIYVQFTGDPAPTGLVKGDIVITQA